jgi:AbrB family looped-hinge helix DNA binding protein
MTCILASCLAEWGSGDTNLQTAVTKRGQTTNPAPIRKRYEIEEGDRLVSLDDGQSIKVIPVPADAIRALRGCGRGERLVERLLAARLKAVHRLSLAHAFIAAYASRENAILLHEDPEFEVLDGQGLLEAPPYKNASVP